MNKNGIDSKRTDKRDAGSFLLFVFLLPYVCACLWGHVGEETGKLRKNTAGEQDAYMVEVSVEWGVWELPLEEYLVYQLSLTMPDDYHSEAKKAQAVLLRTELAAMYQEQDNKKIVADGEGLTKFYLNGRGETEELLRKNRQAVKATEGLILTYRGEPIRASYFKLSNGFTRAARTAGEQECPYLSKVACEQDQTSPDYHSAVRVDKEIYIDKIQGILGGNVERETIWEGEGFFFDESGYMTKVSYYDEDGEKKEVDGETFRHLFGLNSASFEMTREEKSVIFHVTGVGHGFGMSQFEANCRAERGETYKEILAGFFFQTALAKFE
ncbi:MAG: SpoIID/LytB domain-containing protein [Lachnospiraceae bacterium]|nr:SpoIID/LytB domain-containing protein [Lachnospiraceae bacterium]